MSRRALRALERVSTVASLFRHGSGPNPMVTNQAPAEPWVVHKFGGSSVADADCFRRVATILDSLPAQRLGIVLSACHGVTDALLRLVSLAERQGRQLRGRDCFAARTARGHCRNAAERSVGAPVPGRLRPGLP